MNKSIEEMSYRELVEFVKSSPLYTSEDEDRALFASCNFIVATSFYASNQKGDDENGVTMSSHFLPFFAKYYPNLNVKVGDEFGDLVQRHELGLLKAVVEYHIAYEEGIPGSKRTDAHWQIQSLQNSNYTIGYEFWNEPDSLMDHEWHYVQEHANDNVYSIEEAQEKCVVEVTLTDDSKLKWQSVEASVDKEIYRKDGNGHLLMEMHGGGYGETATEAMENLKQMLPPDMNFVLKVAADSKTVEEIDSKIAAAKLRNSYY